MTDDQEVLNDAYRVQAHPCDTRHDLLISSLQEIKNEVARVSERLTTGMTLSHGSRDAYPQLPRRLLSPLADYPEKQEVVLAHFIPQRQTLDYAFFQFVTMRYLQAYGAEPMLAKRNGHLYAEHHGFLNRRASTHLVTRANIEGDVFWLPDPTDHQIWPALVIDATGETPADLRTRIEPHMKGQFTIEGFGPKFVLCFQIGRDFVIAKMHLG